MKHLPSCVEESAEWKVIMKRSTLAHMFSRKEKMAQSRESYCSFTGILMYFYRASRNSRCAATAAVNNRLCLRFHFVDDVFGKPPAVKSKQENRSSLTALSCQFISHRLLFISIAGEIRDKSLVLQSASR